PIAPRLAPADQPRRPAPESPADFHAFLERGGKRDVAADEVVGETRVLGVNFESADGQHSIQMVVARKTRSGYESIGYAGTCTVGDEREGWFPVQCRLFSL